VGADDRELYGGLVRLHILHHAAREPVFGLGMIEELGEHGYRLSPGTLYPILYRMEHKGYLRSARQRAGRHTRRVYRITPAGRRALAVARERVQELFGELFELRAMHHGRERLTVRMGDRGGSASPSSRDRNARRRSR
jgi:DNA-binding PadR family transcriptional regulator